ncbi:MAG: hypothetical protein LBG57_09960 [Treponema sp.]|jgi:hypothetical protein|nr:hypothetical protein [Treponema sp.]
MKTFKFSLLFMAGMLVAAVFSGCDMLNKPEIDVGDNIDQAVAWQFVALLGKNRETFAPCLEFLPFWRTLYPPSAGYPRLPCPSAPHLPYS